jgi:hypothetical protein
MSPPEGVEVFPHEGTSAIHNQINAKKYIPMKLRHTYQYTFTLQRIRQILQVSM